MKLEKLKLKKYHRSTDLVKIFSNLIFSSISELQTFKVNNRSGLKSEVIRYNTAVTLRVLPRLVQSEELLRM